MADVDIRINDRPYRVGCAEGQEDRVRELAELYSAHVEAVSRDVGNVGEVRLLLLGALLLADEVMELRTELAVAHSATSRISTGTYEVERRASEAITRAAERLEKLAAQIGD